MTHIDITENHLKRAAKKRIVFGILAIFFGVLWLLKNVGIFEGVWADQIVSWKTLLISIGFIGLAGDKNGSTFNFILIFAGFFWLFADVYDWDIDFTNLWQVFWPLVLIIAGFSAIMKYSKLQKKAEQEILSSTNMLDSVAIFGGSDIKITSDQFQGGKITAIFGGSQIDLTRAELADGEHVIEVFNLFGGCTILVPSHWNVKIEVSGVLGGFQDDRKLFGTTAYDNSKVLIIKGSAILGGGELKSF